MCNFSWAFPNRGPVCTTFLKALWYKHKLVHTHKYANMPMLSSFLFFFVHLGHILMLCCNRTKIIINCDTVQTLERACGPPEGIMIKPHWPWAEQRGRKNHFDLQREKSQGTNPTGRLVHQRREGGEGGEGRGGLGTERNRGREREREGGEGEEWERQRGVKTPKLWLDKRGQVPEAGKKLYLLFLGGRLL